MELFDSNFLKRLQYLSIVSRRVFRGQLLAQRRTKQLGGGIEFADHRQYTAGDDLRYLDWNIYARFDDMLLKRFQEEEDLHVYFLLDLSPSMTQGDASKFQRKFDLARRVTAALAYIALADLDRVSVLAYADGVQQVLPMTRGRNQILSVMRFLERLEPTGTQTRLAAAAKDLVHRAQRTGLVVILSDFFDQEGFRSGIDQLRYRRFEPHVIQLYTQEEAEPNLLGDVELIEVETGDRRKLTINERKLRQYKELFRTFMDDMENYCRHYSLSYSRSTADTPFDDLVMQMMRASMMHV